MLSFEQAVKKLEDISDKLRSGELSLEESAKLYEESKKYFDQCNKILAETKQRFEVYDPEKDKTEEL
jgi:exodeoxyribonuclease VII small subunit